MTEMIPLSKPCIGIDELDAIQDVMCTGCLAGTCEEVTKFEEEFAAYCGTKFAVGVDSGVSSIELSLRALGVGSGDEVIVPTHTFTATAAAVTFTGATPVFVDANPVTWNIDVEKIEAAITPRTKAIVPVHLYGLPAEMDEIMRIAKSHNLVQ